MLLHRLASLLLTALITFPAAALARDYHVEVVIFERGEGSGSPEEFWNFSREALQGKFMRMTELAAQSVEVEFEDVQQLAGVRDSLEQGGYTVLRAASWDQPSAIFQNAPVVSLGDELSAMPFGYVRVYKTSLIFADIDLQLSPLNSGFQEFSSLPELEPDAGIESVSETGEPKIPHYFLSEKRRLKFEELHYFDHPKFGAIVGVWPKESDGG